MRYRLPFLITAALLTVQVQAVQLLYTNAFTVAQDETLDGELWVKALDADVNGNVENDLFLSAGNRASLGGSFGHNLWCAADFRKNGIIHLTGTVKHNTRLMASTVQVSGQADGNLLVMGNTIKLGTNAVVGGHAVLLGNSIILEGRTEGDVSITATRSATIAGTIAGNVNITAPEIILQRNARIGGDLTYTSGQELVPAEGIVAGTLERAVAPSLPVFTAKRLSIRVYWILAALLVGLPFVALFPMSTAMASQLVRTSPGKCLWAGALCLIALLALGMISIPSGIGLPLGLLILGGWAFMAYASHIVIGLVIGTLILRKNTTSIGHVLLAMTAGLSLIYLITLIPAISLPIWLIVTSMGSGALLLSLIQKRRLMIRVPEELKQLEALKKQQTTNEQEEK